MGKLEDKLDMSLGDMIKSQNKANKKKKKKTAKKSGKKSKKKQPQKKKTAKKSGKKLKKKQPQKKKKKKPAPKQKKKASKGFIAHVAKLRKNMEEKGRKPKGVYEDDQQKAARLKRAAKARKTYIEARNLLRKKRRTE